MINLSKNLPLDFYFMLSSCVPATHFESSGAKLESEDLLPLYNNEKVLGLAMGCKRKRLSNRWTWSRL